MASRRDLVQGYQFAARRVVSAVVAHDGDPVDWPLRRLGGAGFATVMLTVLALAAVGIYGLVVPGGKTSWRDGKSVIVEAETGARYVYLDGRLHPVLNFSSAALVIGSTGVTRVHHRSLAGTPRGTGIGIPGAPDALPGTKDLLRTPWSMCSEQTRDATGRLVARTVLALAGTPSPGERPADRALLVTEAESGTWYLVWHDHRYQITDRNVVGVALGLLEQVNVPVGAAWLQALPAGLPIGPLTVADAGKPSVVVGGATIGQVLVVGDGATATGSYLVDRDQLVPLTELQARIQRAVPGAPASRTVPASSVSGARRAAPPAAGAEQPPVTVPGFVRPDTAAVTLCAVYQRGSFTPVVSFGGRVPGGGAGTETTRVTGGGVALADRVWVQPGRGALVEALPSPESTDGPLYLVVDTGRRHAVTTVDVLAALGYRDVAVVRLPASLLVRIPEGAALDAAAARSPVVDRPAS